MTNGEGFRSRRFVPDDLYACAPHVVEALVLRQGEFTSSQQSHHPTGLRSGPSSSKMTPLFQRLPFKQNSKEKMFDIRSMSNSNFMIPSISEPLAPGTIELYSPKYFLACAVGGIFACGLTHAAMTPVDVVKCNMQIDPQKYKSIGGGFRTAIGEQGVARGLFRGWAPTLLGYSVQGMGKYGFYEYFKHLYSEAAGSENASKYRTVLYLAASASSELLADIGLAPFEAVKVRVQTQPGFARGIVDGLPKILAQEGLIGGLYKGMVPLWGRQVPYTMMKFATYENTVEALYKNVMPAPKDQCSAGVQLGVSFAAGYIAGVACAVISHPADNLVSYLNSSEGATVSRALKEMGSKALLTRGLPLRIFMVGTLTAAQWSIYDGFKVFVGLPTTGGPPPPVSQEPDFLQQNN